ncbi:MAG: iron-sulfur cluster assembly scaffold protein [Candidatus Omnitrophica bacterium]|nr:iron-sulfur cluster assembly scaffold protein [Candidatus Omnitrophota bacterium]MBU1767180.1 iron-sulfur cluster assembly scaffold protein [Candidatus Omnitrophota bacterium]MBU1889125.1 iron-sulfur cluster assembly scaffold protein [Candidatus Omnitrophota bacterium]
MGTNKIKIMHEENLSGYSENIIKISQNLKHFGRMNDPTSVASIKGPCGDEMEFYLIINNGIIEDVKFYTDGCIATKACGSMAARFAFGKTIEEVLSISPQKIIESLKGLPKDHCHCSILAVSTLYRAIADYLLKK